MALCSPQQEQQAHVVMFSRSIVLSALAIALHCGVLALRDLPDILSDGTTTPTYREALQLQQQGNLTAAAALYQRDLSDKRSPPASGSITRYQLAKVYLLQARAKDDSSQAKRLRLLQSAERSLDKVQQALPMQSASTSTDAQEEARSTVTALHCDVILAQVS